MTLIASAVSPDFIIQVSDRLVSRDVPRGFRRPTHDAAFNKTIVFEAADSLLLLSFSGAAYIGNMPSDRWIAEVLTEQDLAGDSWPQGVFGAQMRPGLRSRRASDHLRRLMDRVNDAVDRGLLEVEQHAFWIVIAGWIWREGRIDTARQILYRLVKSARRPIVMTRYTPKAEQKKMWRIVWTPPGWIKDTEELEVWKRLGDAKNAPQVCAVLIDQMRRISQRNPDSIGGDLLLAGAYRPTSGICRTQYWPSVSIADEDARGYSPWLCTSRLVVGPSRVLGRLPVRFPVFRVDVVGAAPRGGLLVSVDGQPRKPRP